MTEFPGVLRKSGVIRVIPTCQVLAVELFSHALKSAFRFVTQHWSPHGPWGGSNNPRRSQRELGRRCLNLWLQSRHTRHGGRNHHLGTPFGPGFHDLINVWNHLGFAWAPKKNSPIFPPVIVDLTTGTSNLLYINLKKKTSAQQIQGAAFRRQRMYGLRSAKRWYASIFSSWPWHGVAYLSWHFSKATQEQRSVDQFIYKPWHCKYKYYGSGILVGGTYVYLSTINTNQVACR